MALSGHQFFWAFADSFGTVAAKEGAVIEEELPPCHMWTVLIGKRFFSTF
jgi:hypothetical protein